MKKSPSIVLDTELDLKLVNRFFELKISRYIFLVIDDQRILKDLIAVIQNQLRKEEILVLELDMEKSSIYSQVKEFFDKNKGDGLIITKIDELLSRYPDESLFYLNMSRDGFEDFPLPIALVVNEASFKKNINGTSDFYQIRDLPEFHFEGVAQT